MARLPAINLGSNPLVQRIIGSVASTGLGRAAAPIMRVLGLQERGNSFILNIGDEGATLVQVHAGEVVDAVFAEAASEDGWVAMREALQAEPTARIVIVADVLEQMFREDTVPKVGILDRSKIVKRRLDLTFPNEILKAALRLPRVSGAPQTVLFTALPMSPHLERWVAFLDEFPNPLSGFYMLPLEVVGIAGKIGPSTQGETRRVWRALITQEAASGFRQIFESGGKLIVTRLTQRPSQPLTPDGEAMLIERELRSSISYIKRLGFSDADRLDVVVLADPAVCRAVDERDLPATTVTVNTPYQAGVLLNMGEVGRDDSPFADVLLGLWIAKKRQPILTLPTARIANQMRMTSILRWSAAATAALTILTVAYMGSLLSDFVDDGNEIAGLETKIQAATADLKAERARMQGYAIPLDELTTVADTERRLTLDEFDIGGTVRKISGALAADARMLRMTYALVKVPANATQKAKPKAAKDAKDADTAPPYEIHVTVKFPGTADPASTKEAVERAKSVLARLTTAFPSAEVRAERMPTDVAVNEILEGTAEATKTPQDQQNQQNSTATTAEYVIRTAT